MRTLIIISALVLGGCASGYHSLKPSTNYFQNGTEYYGVEFSYRMGVLREHGNKKYGKREDKKAIRVVSVKLVNHTNEPVVVGEDFRFYSGNSELVLINPYVAHRELKQGVPIYLLYLPLTFLQLNTYDENGSVDTTPIGLFIGPGIAIGNMLGAGAANQNFLRELEQFNIINKTIEPGQTVHGLISIRDNGYNPIRLEFDY